jgi:hypothetical protein
MIQLCRRAGHLRLANCGPRDCGCPSRKPIPFRFVNYNKNIAILLLTHRRSNELFLEQGCVHTVFDLFMTLDDTLDYASRLYRIQLI